MRYFSEIEKEIIDYICEAEPTSDASTIKKLFEKECCCSMQWNNDALIIYIQESSSSQEIVTQILNIICLLDYLKSEGLIYLFANRKVSNRLINKEHGHITIEEILPEDIIDGGLSIPMYEVKINGSNAHITLSSIVLSKDISLKIIEFFNYTFVCSETLRHIKGQKYKDDTTVQYEENKEQTEKAIRISLRIGIGSIFVGIFVGLLTYCQNEKHHLEDMSKPEKIVIVHDTIIPSYQSIIPKSTNILPKATNDSLKSNSPKYK